MRHWIRNISGGLALLLLGVALQLTITKGNEVLGGNRTLVLLWTGAGAALIVALLATDWVGRRMPGLRRRIHITYEYTRDTWLVVGIRNDGTTIAEADLTLMLPESFSILRYETGRKDESPKGRMDFTSETLQPEDTKAIYWVEPQVRLSGGGNTTQFGFRTHNKPGTYPVLLKLYADELGSLEKPDTFVIPYTDKHRELERKQREQTRSALMKASGEILWNKDAMVKAMGSAHYWPSGERAINELSSNIETHLRRSPRFPEIREAYEDAFRIALHPVARQSDKPPILATDGLENAVVSSLWALIVIEDDLKRIDAELSA